MSIFDEWCTHETHAKYISLQRLNVLYMMYIRIYDRVNDRILMAFQLSDRVSRYLANEISQRIKYLDE